MRANARRMVSWIAFTRQRGIGNVCATRHRPREGEAMPRPIINEEECSGCGICVDACPSGVLELVGDVAEPVNEDDCTACGTCEEECPMGAIQEIEED
jgi:NAD-dependent dihydropyrimidine dehydrogenase PreA subunit